LTELVFSTSEWWNDKKNVQSKLATHQDPVIDLQELEKRKSDVLNLFTKLINKPKPVAPKEAPKQADVDMKDATESNPESPSEDAKMD